MAATRPAPFETRVAVGIGGALVGATFTVIGLLLLVSLQMNGLPVALFLTPVLLAASWPAFVRQARRERDQRLAQLLMLALCLKLFGSLVRYWVAIYVYDGFADALMYHDVGTNLAMRFRGGDFSTGLDSLSSTDFIRFFTGLVYTVTGSSVYAGFLLYSWLGFWGMFYLYRAFVTAVPDGNRRSYARLLFFLPSMLYWPSSIGKEAWMLFCLGLAAFGTARLLTGRPWRGLALAGTALWLGALVRPHVTGMAALALVAAYLVARPPRRLGALGPVVKLFALIALLAVAGLLLGKASSYLLEKGIDPQDGFSNVLGESARRTGQGGSSFNAPTAIGSPAKLPLALESTLLLCLTVARRRGIWQALRHPRRRPYVAFVVVYSLLFVFAFSSIANFGILARERTQVLPFFLVLLAIPAARRAPGQAKPNDRRVDAGRQLTRA